MGRSLYAKCLPGLILGSLLLLGACQTSSNQEDQRPVLQAMEPMGRVMAVYPGQQLVLVDLRATTRLSIEEEALYVTRNANGTITGIVQPSSTRRGRTMGFLIQEGLPNSGDDLYQHASSPVHD